MLHDEHDNNESRDTPKLASLSWHLILLTRFFVNYLPHPEDVTKKRREWARHPGEEYWRKAANALFMAASIEEISLYFSILDPNAGYCRPAYEYDVAKDNLVSQYVQEATRFMWSWVSFEDVVDKLCRSAEGNSRTDRAINYINNFQCKISNERDRHVNFLSKILDASIKKSASRAARKSNSLHFLHIHYCREIRNSIFHDAIGDIEPSDTGRHFSYLSYKAENDPRVAQVKISTRLTLFAIQEMLEVYLHGFPGKTDEVDEDEGEYDYLGIRAGVNLSQALQSLHLVAPDELVE